MRAIRKVRNFLRPNTTTTSSVAAIAVLAVAGCHTPSPDLVVPKLKPVAKEANFFRRWVSALVPARRRYPILNSPSVRFRVNFSASSQTYTARLVI